MNTDASLKAEVEFLDNVENEKMPTFGVTFKINKEYENIEWYGNEALESSIDRKKSIKTIVAKNKVIENFVPYLKPQDCGNKTDIRYISIYNENGYGLKVSADEVFEGSVFPYTSHEMENARNSSVVTLSKFNTGVRGDDSWGAKPHPEHKFVSKDIEKFVFNIEII